jgi:AcrR family transcriptional regulator
MHAVVDQRAPKPRRTRLTPDQRRTQLRAAAKTLIVSEGVQAVTMRRLAGIIGIGEAQAHNYYRRDELLVEIAREELADMEANRQADIRRGTDFMMQLVLGTVGYLREVEARGALIQPLLASPEVRKALRGDRVTGSNAVGQRMAARFDMPAEIGGAGTRILASVARRAGRLLADGRLDPGEAERLALAMILAGNRRMIERWGRKPL